MGSGAGADDDGFAVFFRAAEPALRRALTAAYGPAVGREAAAEALAYAWEHWKRVATFANPLGYLYRVGQTSARRQRRPLLVVARAAAASSDPWVEPALGDALQTLTEHQRVAVVLCHGFAWTHTEVAALLGVSPSTVQNHVERGLAKLRQHLEVNSDA